MLGGVVRLTQFVDPLIQIGGPSGNLLLQLFTMPAQRVGLLGLARNA